MHLTLAPAPAPAHTTVGLTLSEVDALIALLTAARDAARTEPVDHYGNALPVFLHLTEGRFGGPVEVMTAHSRIGEGSASWIDAHTGSDCD